MNDQPTPRVNRRWLLAGAALGGVLLGLLLLVTVFSGGSDGGDVDIAIAPGANRAQTTTVPVSPPGEDVGPFLPDSSDPFRQNVTVTDSQSPLTGAGTPQASAGASPVTAVGGSTGNALAEAGGGGSVPAPSADEAQPAGNPRASSTTEPMPPAGTSSAPTSTLTGTTLLNSAATAAPAPTSSTAPPSTLSSSTTIPPSTIPPSTIPPYTIPPYTIPPTTIPPTTTIAKPPAGIAFTSARDGNQEIYVIDPDGRNELRLTNDPGADREPAWSPDGAKLAFVSDRAGRPEIYVMGGEGGSPIRVTQHPGSPASPTWGKDGESIAFESTDAISRNREIFLVSAKTGDIRQLTWGACPWSVMSLCPEGEIAHRQPAFSPDGSTIAFIRVDRTGQRVFVMSVDGSMKRTLGGKWSSNPAWSADGRRIAYDDVDGIRVVDARGDGHVVVPGTAWACSTVAPCPVLFEPSWSPDGTRLAVRDRSTGPTGGDLHVIDLDGKQDTRLNPGLKASAPKWFSPSRRP